LASEEHIEVYEDAVRSIIEDLVVDVVIQRLLVEAVRDASEKLVSGESVVEEEAGSKKHGG